MKAIVFTRSAFASARQQPAKWWHTLRSLSPGKIADALELGIKNEIAVFWCDPTDDIASLLVIGCPEIFENEDSRNAVTAAGRIAKLMQIGLGGGRMPPEFGQFRHGNKISAFAYNYGSGQQRVVAEARPRGSVDFYVCGFGKDEGKNLSAYDPDYGLYEIARSSFGQVFPTPTDATARSVTLGPAYERIGTSIGSNKTWQSWLGALNPGQAEFIKMPMDRPIRLRGTAGTGKTLTLAIKAMTLLNAAKDKQQPCRILFLTHSWALAEAADQLMDQLDPGCGLRQDDRSIDVWPLLTLADSRVRLGSASRRLLGSDSRSGKIEVLRRLERHLEAYIGGDWITRRGGCGRDFVDRMEAQSGSVARQLILLDLMNEFATVFAAAGIHPRKRADYLRLPRRKWMLKLETDSEKEAVADLYQAYFEGLEADGLTGPEQLVSDYLKALSTFEWQRLRKAEGFDFIFVDEMHLFDEQERFVIHQLLADESIRPRVAMAIDPKQSPLEFFVSHGRSTATVDSGEIYKRANLPNPHKLELTSVFRNTRQIQTLIQVLLDLMMNPDSNDEWDTPKPQPASSATTGEIPGYQIHETSLLQFRSCFEVAKKMARSGDKKKVGIICMDAERFDTYLTAASNQFKGEYISISSQEDLIESPEYSRRFVVTMPEYVQGLQFDRVLVLDVNEDMTSETASGFHRKHFLTDLYMACSRARESLELHASKAEGGLSTLLNNAIAAGVIKAKE